MTSCITRALCGVMLLLLTVAVLGAAMNEFDIKNPRTIFPDNPRMQNMGQLVMRDDAVALTEALKAVPAAANEPGVHGVGLLMLAVANSRLSATRALMRAGADPHQPTSSIANLGRPAALALRMRGEPDILSIMLEEGLDINGGRERQGEVLLVLAVYERGDARLRQLLATGKANPNLANAAQTTPLLTAIKSNQYAKAMLLLDAGADPALGRVNPLQELARHRWDAGTPSDFQVKHLAQRLREMGLTELTPMRAAPVRPYGPRT